MLVSQARSPIDPGEGSFRPASALYEYETGPVEYVHRYPAIAEGIEVKHIRCIDLWLHLDSDGRIRCELEGRPLEELLESGGHVDDLATYEQAQVGEIPQLEAIALALSVVLDAATHA